MENSDLSKIVAVVLGFLAIYLVIAGIVWLLTIIAKWIIYKKAGQPGWAAIIPFYHKFVLFKISWKNALVVFLVWLILSIGSSISGFKSLGDFAESYKEPESISEMSSGEEEKSMTSEQLNDLVKSISDASEETNKSSGNEIVSIIGTILGIIEIITNVKLAKAFGHGTGFAIGLIFLNFIFMLILAFGKSQYQGLPVKDEPAKIEPQQ